MAIAPSADKYRIEALDRGLVLLDTLAQMPGSSAAELARALNINRGLVFRLLRTLGDRGFVSKDQHHTFRLGPRLLHLGQQAQLGSALVDASNSILDGLRHQTQENVSLIVQEQLEIIGLSLFLSPHLIQIAASMGARGAVYATSAGKMLLAFADEDLVDDIIERFWQDFTPIGMRDKHQIRKLFDQIRTDDYYIAVGESHGDVTIMSAPVRDGRNAVVAAASIMGPSNRVNTAAYLPLLLRAARDISAKLGNS